MTGFETLVAEVVEATITDNAEMVAAWQAGTPKSWGYLAGRAVGSTRGRLNRTLTDEERRLVWAMLWAKLQELRRSSAQSSGG